MAIYDFSTRRNPLTRGDYRLLGGAAPLLESPLSSPSGGGLTPGRRVTPSPTDLGVTYADTPAFDPSIGERAAREESAAQAARVPPASFAGLDTAISPSILSPSFASEPAIRQPALESQQELRLGAELASQGREQEAQIASRALQERAGLAEKGFGRRLEAIRGLDTASGAVPRVTRPAAVGGAMTPEERAARAFAFAQAKEAAGANALASLKALQDVVESRGLMGSTVESAAAGGAIGGARADINDFIGQQLIADLERSGDIADLTYQGDITQRGQDLSRIQSLLGLLAGGGGLY